MPGINDGGFRGFAAQFLPTGNLFRGGANRIDIELTNSNRNLLGPHHAEVREPLSVGPGTFKNQVFIDKYNFIPFGITRGVRIVYKKARDK